MSDKTKEFCFVLFWIWLMHSFPLCRAPCRWEQLHFQYLEEFSPRWSFLGQLLLAHSLGDFKYYSKIVSEAGGGSKRELSWIFLNRWAKPVISVSLLNHAISMVRSVGGPQHCCEGTRKLWWHQGVFVAFECFCWPTNRCNYMSDLCLQMHTFLVCLPFGGPGKGMPGPRTNRDKAFACGVGRESFIAEKVPSYPPGQETPAPPLSSLPLSNFPFVAVASRATVALLSNHRISHQLLSKEHWSKQHFSSSSCSVSSSHSSITAVFHHCLLLS